MDVTKDKILSEVEAKKLLALLRQQSQGALDAERLSFELDEVVVVALLLSGLRNSEFCALTVADAVLNKDEPAFIVRGSPGRSRTVHIPRYLCDMVRRYVEHVRPRMMPAGVHAGDPERPLVLNERGRPYERTGLYRRVVRILTEAGLGDRASVQLLRHTYGYMAYLRTGGNLLFVQRQLGHVHPRITAAYAELVDESYAELADRILPAEQEAVSLPKRADTRRRPEFDCEID